MPPSLTDQLRAMAGSWYDPPRDVCEMLVEAADRIDALEAALDEIANAEAGPLGMQRIARGVLAARVDAPEDAS